MNTSYYSINSLQLFLKVTRPGKRAIRLPKRNKPTVLQGEGFSTIVKRVNARKFSVENKLNQGA